VTADDRRRVDAYHESGHAVMLYGLGYSIKYVCINYAGGVTQHEGLLSDDDLLLVKAAGVVAAELSLCEPTLNQLEHIRNGGQRDFDDCRVRLETLYESEMPPGYEQLPWGERATWRRERYEIWEMKVREIFSRQDIRDAICEVAEGLLVETPHFRDANWRYCHETDAIHQILASHIIFGSLSTAPEETLANEERQDQKGNESRQCPT